MKRIIASTIVLAVVVLALTICQIFYPVYAKQITLSDPWTYQAATFNPKGVKFHDGVTTGREISENQVTWTESVKQAVIQEINQLKAQ